MHRTRQPSLASILRFPLALAAVAFISWQILRVVLVLRFGPPAMTWGEAAQLFAVGWHADLAWAVAGVSIIIGFSAFFTTLLTAPVALLLQPFKVRAWGPLWRVLFRIAVTVGALVGVFLLLSEWFFFDEFESRFNTVAIDYLIYPHEVFTNIWESYPVVLIVVTCLVMGGGISWLAFHKAAPVWRDLRLGRKLQVIGMWTLMTVLLPMTFSHSETRFSAQRVVNELAGNGWASAMHAAWSRNLDYAAFYRVMDRREAFLRARKLLAEPGAEFIAPEVPAPPASPATADDERRWLDAARDSITRDIAGDPAQKKRNVCIIAEESFGSEFWGCLGRTVDGVPHTLTPRMDDLAAKEGLLFTRMLADGNRTIRGMEAIFSSFPPLPGDSILARDKTENVETLARVLKRDGYQTLFLYAGHGTFDFIKTYALNNGWDRMVEESDFDNPAFHTAWGVSDEDLLQRGITEMRELHDTGKPFLTTFLTVSNHRPFTYPAGRIPEDPDAHRREHAVKYADWALGDFFDRARKEPFWDDTIFVVVADHGARVYGRQTIPLKSYQIPCLVVAPGLITEPQRNNAPGSQLDVVPTVLGMIGRPYRSLFFGHDLLKDGGPDRSRSLINHNRSIAVYHDRREVVFGLHQSIEYWFGEAASVFMKLIPDAAADTDFREIRDDGVSLFQVADDLYVHRHYAVTKQQDSSMLH